MLLFKEEHVAPILLGTKTQTRRIWTRARARVGGKHLCYTRLPFARPPGQPFARIEILAVRTKPLGTISEEDARAEGYDTVRRYLRAFAKINGAAVEELRDVPVYVVEFELVQAPEWLEGAETPDVRALLYWERGFRKARPLATASRQVLLRRGKGEGACAPGVSVQRVEESLRG